MTLNWINLKKICEYGKLHNGWLIYRTCFCFDIAKDMTIIWTFNFLILSLNNTKHPNTYTLSKALAEDIIYSYHKKIPIAVMRPSLVWFAVEEPFKGYISGMHSGIGIICGGMTGFIRSMYVGNESEAKLTPVDYTVNATIVAAWNRSLVSSDELLVYNCTDSKENPFLWKQGAVVAKKPFYDFAPYEKLFWYPKISYTSSYAWHMISMILFQLFPAILYDLVRLLSGGKPM